MKKQLLMCLLAATAMTGFTSCDDDDDNYLKTSQVPEACVAALQSRYPDATDVRWERKHKYYVAEFRNVQRDYDVWYAADATWAMTEIDYGKNLFFLPAVVSEAFATGEYGTGYTVDDISEYQRPQSTFYEIEVEPQGGGKDVYLYYDEQGNLFKTATVDVDITPDTVI